MLIDLKRRRTLVETLLVLFLATFVQAGCGQARGYPETTVTSPLGREGTCVTCSRKIDSVTALNLVTVEGNQFIVCGDECAEKADQDVEHVH